MKHWLYVACLAIGVNSLHTQAPRAAGATSPSQSGCEPPAETLRSATLSARSANPNDTSAFLRALDTTAGVSFGSAPSVMGIYEVHRSDSLSIVVIPRYVGYRFALEEQIRKMEPIEKAALLDGYQVVVTPKQVNAPDIIKVVVTKDGVPIEPTANTLKPTEFSSRVGLKASLHAGYLLYPCSAFQPLSMVAVTAIPESGSNVTKVFMSDELRRMR